MSDYVILNSLKDENAILLKENEILKEKVMKDKEMMLSISRVKIENSFEWSFDVTNFISVICV